jgi:hypothetical protein
MESSIVLKQLTNERTEAKIGIRRSSKWKTEDEDAETDKC